MSEPKAITPAQTGSSGDATPAAGARARAPRTKRAGAGAARGRLSRAVDHVAANPLTAVVGAVAISAGLAFLLPSSERESEVMGDVAEKLGEVARDAADDVVAAGRAQVETLAKTALAGVGGAVLHAVSGNDDAIAGR